MTMTEPNAQETGLSQILERLPADREARVAFLHKLLGEGPCRQIGIFPLPPGFKLSVVIPVYNEERWLAELVRRVQVVPIPKELILINDQSTDGTPAILKQLEERYDNVRVFHQPKNMGKGAALREGFKHCTGDLVIVQDADWEYDPAEFPKLIQPIVENRADVVIGSRFIGEQHRVLYYWHSVANKGLTP
jgi:glycosyltransferase involved in cell wall biosynthesis